MAKITVLGLGPGRAGLITRESWQLLSSEELPVVGDYVTFAYNPKGESTILSVCERTSLLQRPDQAKTGVMQYMAANVDVAFIVTSLNEDYSYNRIARYSSVALEAGVKPVVILTKSDLCGDVDRYIEEVKSISDRIEVHAVSALQGIGVDAIQWKMSYSGSGTGGVKSKL